jgi:hypothetical protein
MTITVRTVRMATGFVLFQGAWFACVLFAARGEPTTGVAVVAAVVCALVWWNGRPGADLRLVALALAIGAVWDSLLAHTGVVRYVSPGPFAGWAPAWILAMWALFAPMLREPMRWLHPRPILASVFGAVGGAASYAAAEHLGACTFPDRALAMFVLGLGWALIMPLLLAAAQRIDRGTEPRDATRAPTEVRA